MAATQSQRTAEFPEKLGFLFEHNRWRYKVAHGGRGSGKSWSFARALLILAAQIPMRVLCCREIQKSIAESVHDLLEEQVSALGFRGFYDVQERVIRGANGSEFIFAGLYRNVDSIKSMEGLDVVWVEEAHSVSEESWRKLIPTVRKPGSEIWVSFNPDLDDDPAYKRFVLEPPPDAKVMQVCWQDNPWFPGVLAREKDYDYAHDPETADHVWGGNTRKNTHAAVLRGRWVVESFKPGADWDGPYFGADWGFGVDPTAAVKLWVHERRLYVEHEAYGLGVDLDDTPELFDAIPGAREHVMRADCSRPETISHMRRHGYKRIVACHKGAGSVEDGVEHLRSYEQIVIHPRCPNTAREAKLWSYKTNNAGDVLPVLKDGNDNCWDSARYALEPIIRAGKPKPKPKPKPRAERDYKFESNTSESWRTV